MAPALYRYCSVCFLLLLSAPSKQETGGPNLTEGALGAEKEHSPAGAAAAVNPILTSNITGNQTTVPPQVKAIPDVQSPLTDVEKPKLAANHVKGASGLNSTQLITEPDSINKDLGSRCTTDKDCAELNNTFCSPTSLVCECKGGFIPSKHSLDKCVKIPSGLGDVCQEEAQCNHAVPDSECRDGKCACPPNYVYDGATRCWEKQILGGSCNVTMQCDVIKSATCVQGVCTCDAPLIPSPENKCLQPAGKAYPAPCEEDIQCSYSYGDEARCSNGQCRCTNDYHYNGTACARDKKLGETCSTGEDCKVEEINGAEGSRTCIVFECSCAPGFTALTGENICTKSAAEEMAVSLVWLVCIFVSRYYLA